jgi:hypothetical protein
LESSFSCNGICRAGAFYYFVDISQGPPTDSCLPQIKKLFNQKPTAVGVLLLISFLLTFFSFFTAYGLCYSKENKH